MSTKSKALKCLSWLIGYQQSRITGITTVMLYDPVREKTNNLGSDQVQHKLVCTVTEAGQKLENSDLSRRGTGLSV